MKKLLVRYGTIEMCSKAGRGFDRYRKLDDIPSYVPDWSSLPVCSSLLRYFKEETMHLKAQDQAISLLSNGDLQLEVFCVAVVQIVVDQKPEMTGSDLLQWLDAAELLALQHARYPYPNRDPPSSGITVSEAFWRTLVADSTLKKTRAPVAWSGELLKLKTLMGTRRGLLLGSDLDSVRPRGQDVNGIWYHQFHRVTGSRSFCVTDGGMIGMVPLDTHSNDLVCLVPGGVVPYIMRRKDPADERSSPEIELVGESYIHGIDAVADMKELRGKGEMPRKFVFV